MTDLNYAIAVIHKRTKSMALKNAIVKTFKIRRNNLSKFRDKDMHFAIAGQRHWNLFAENDVLGPALFLTYGTSDYTAAHKLLEIALEDNPDSDLGKFLISLNNHECDPVSSSLLDYVTEVLESKELNSLLANYSVETGEIPDSMDFFLESIKVDKCIKSQRESLSLLKNAAKKFFELNNFEFSSSLFEDKKEKSIA